MGNSKHNVGQNHGKGMWRDARCPSGKLTFETKGRAKRYMKDRNLRQKAYKCSECRYLHLTSLSYSEMVKRGLIEL